MQLTIRKAEARDIAAIHALVESGYRGESARVGWTHEADLLGGQRTDREAVAEIIASSTQVFLLTEAAGALVGCVQVADRGPRREADGTRVHAAYLGMLTVRPALQGSGLGRRLIAAAEHHARVVLDADILEMTVIKQRHELIDWYIRRGYVLTGREEPFPHGEPRFGIPRTPDLVFVVLAKHLRIVGVGRMQQGHGPPGQ